MNIGYACLTLGVPETDFRSCTMKNADDERLVQLIAHNLSSLENIIDYNIRSKIRLFRISSDIIPFASSPVNRLPWWDLFETQLMAIGKKLKEGNIRVSMHPGQYTVLNSADEDVVDRAIADLDYHARVLDALCTNTENKIILHIGGIYGDKEHALLRFEENYLRLPQSVKRRLVIENDDKAYTISDALNLGVKLGIPVVFDNLHHRVNPPVSLSDNYSKDNDILSNAYWIAAASKTWKDADGHQKIHYSQQDADKRPGSHSATIYTDDFLEFYRDIRTMDIDVMLEVKDKNLSAVKCMNLISERKEVKSLEQEWSRYKYLVLEHSPACYDEIRDLLRDKTAYQADRFYQILEAALKMKPTLGNSINAAQHVWGYFKNFASEKEQRGFLKSMEECSQGNSGTDKIKRMLWKLTNQYRVAYLLNSYYFFLE